eukprot:TRINITY_DN20770_c0_g1_i13.p1 TRINITY_DN20770_c0_g1~~TRINITY_DN20770_c0_g1_i13.p1  ORF type:complete len:1637 (+),score=311.73 TRINITY_DN20770_c0_g1_i13:85-4995(+)
MAAAAAAAGEWQWDSDASEAAECGPVLVSPFQIPAAAVPSPAPGESEMVAAGTLLQEPTAAGWPWLWPQGDPASGTIGAVRAWVERAQAALRAHCHELLPWAWLRVNGAQPEFLDCPYLVGGGMDSQQIKVGDRVAMYNGGVVWAMLEGSTEPTWSLHPDEFGTVIDADETGLRLRNPQGAESGWQWRRGYQLQGLPRGNVRVQDWNRAKLLERAAELQEWLASRPAELRELLTTAQAPEFDTAWAESRARFGLRPSAAGCAPPPGSCIDATGRTLSARLLPPASGSGSGGGAYCYFNAVVQPLFHLGAFRNTVYRAWDCEVHLPASGRVCLQLAALFARMQLRNGGPIPTVFALARAVGWGRSRRTQRSIEPVVTALLLQFDEGFRSQMQWPTPPVGDLFGVRHVRSLKQLRLPRARPEDPVVDEGAPPYEAELDTLWVDIDTRGVDTLEEALAVRARAWGFAELPPVLHFSVANQFMCDDPDGAPGAHGDLDVSSDEPLDVERRVHEDGCYYTKRQFERRGLGSAEQWAGGPIHPMPLPAERKDGAEIQWFECARDHVDGEREPDAQECPPLTFQKQGRQFRYGLDLDMTPFVSTAAHPPGTWDPADPRPGAPGCAWRYRLFSVIAHRGDAHAGAAHHSAGHFSSYVAPGNGMQWYLLGQDGLEPVSEAVATDGCFGSEEEPYTRNRAFWLGYVRQEQWDTVVAVEPSVPTDLLAAMAAAEALEPQVEPRPGSSGGILHRAVPPALPPPLTVWLLGEPHARAFAQHPRGGLGLLPAPEVLADLPSKVRWPPRAVLPTDERRLRVWDLLAAVAEHYPRGHTVWLTRPVARPVDDPCSKEPGRIALQGLMLHGRITAADSDEPLCELLGSAAAGGGHAAVFVAPSPPPVAAPKVEVFIKRVEYECSGSPADLRYGGSRYITRYFGGDGVQQLEASCGFQPASVDSPYYPGAPVAPVSYCVHEETHRSTWDRVWPWTVLTDGAVLVFSVEVCAEARSWGPRLAQLCSPLQDAVGVGAFYEPGADGDLDAVRRGRVVRPLKPSLWTIPERKRRRALTLCRRCGLAPEVHAPLASGDSRGPGARCARMPGNGGRQVLDALLGGLVRRAAARSESIRKGCVVVLNGTQSTPEAAADLLPLHQRPAVVTGASRDGVELLCRGDTRTTVPASAVRVVARSAADYADMFLARMLEAAESAIPADTPGTRAVTEARLPGEFVDALMAKFGAPPFAGASPVLPTTPGEETEEQRLLRDRMQLMCFWEVAADGGVHTVLPCDREWTLLECALNIAPKLRVTDGGGTPEYQVGVPYEQLRFIAIERWGGQDIDLLKDPGAWWAKYTPADPGEKLCAFLGRSRGLQSFDITGEHWLPHLGFFLASAATMPDSVTYSPKCSLPLHVTVVLPDYRYSVLILLQKDTGADVAAEDIVYAVARDLRLPVRARQIRNPLSNAVVGVRTRRRVAPRLCSGTEVVLRNPPLSRRHAHLVAWLQPPAPPPGPSDGAELHTITMLIEAWNLRPNRSPPMLVWIRRGDDGRRLREEIVPEAIRADPFQAPQVRLTGPRAVWLSAAGALLGDVQDAEAVHRSARSDGAHLGLIVGHVRRLYAEWLDPDFLGFGPMVKLASYNQPAPCTAKMALAAGRSE